MKNMKLIIGLGNTGKDYENTRHNMGFMLLDLTAQKFEGSWKTSKSRFCDFIKIKIGEDDVILAKPTTFMNLSGKAAAALKNFYKIKNEDILIAQDELDLEPGTFTFSLGGRAGGHHGIESIQQSLRLTDFARLRIGIGKPKNKNLSQSWVLGRPNKSDRQNIDRALQDAEAALEDWVTSGLEKARNQWNSKRKLAK